MFNQRGFEKEFIGSFYSYFPNHHTSQVIGDNRSASIGNSGGVRDNHGGLIMISPYRYSTTSASSPSSSWSSSASLPCLFAQQAAAATAALAEEAETLTTAILAPLLALPPLGSSPQPMPTPTPPSQLSTLFSQALLDNTSSNNNTTTTAIVPPSKKPIITTTAAAVHHFSNPTKLFIGNLPPNVTLCELIDLFQKYGEVNKQLSVVKDDNYAFIHYYDEKSADEAVRHLNGKFFHNRYIRVEYSTSDGHLRKIIGQEKTRGLYHFKSKSSYEIIRSSCLEVNANLARTPSTAVPATAASAMSTRGLRAIKGGTSIYKPSPLASQQHQHQQLTSSKSFYYS